MGNLSSKERKLKRESEYISFSDPMSEYHSDVGERYKTEYMTYSVSFLRNYLQTFGYLDSVMDVFFERFSINSRCSVLHGQLWDIVMSIRTLLISDMSSAMKTEHSLSFERRVILTEQLKLVRKATGIVGRATQILLSLQDSSIEWRYQNYHHLRNTVVKIIQDTEEVDNEWMKFLSKAYYFSAEKTKVIKEEANTAKVQRRVDLALGEIIRHKKAHDLLLTQMKSLSSTERQVYSKELRDCVDFLEVFPIKIREIDDASSKPKVKKREQKIRDAVQVIEDLRSYIPEDSGVNEESSDEKSGPVFVEMYPLRLYHFKNYPHFIRNISSGVQIKVPVQRALGFTDDDDDACFVVEHGEPSAAVEKLVKLLGISDNTGLKEMNYLYPLEDELIGERRELFETFAALKSPLHMMMLYGGLEFITKYGDRREVFAFDIGAHVFFRGPFANPASEEPPILQSIDLPVYLFDPKGEEIEEFTFLFPKFFSKDSFLESRESWFKDSKNVPEVVGGFAVATEDERIGAYEMFSPLQIILQLKPRLNNTIYKHFEAFVLDQENKWKQAVKSYFLNTSALEV